MLDREISPVWHDRFARLIVRNLPAMPEVLALDVHCGTGRTTSELLHRLGVGAKVLAIDPDEGALELAKTRMRPEWKNRVYFKPGHFDDVTAMADDSYNLVVANLVLGESVELSAALGEMIRVCKIGGHLLATVPLHGTWDEVEDIFAEVLRDAGLTAASRRLEALRAIRPTGPQLGQLLHKLGVIDDDYVIEHERFQLLFPSGREFLFAPVIEHGPLQLWKAAIGKDGAPQELFWRLKEAIDTYYSGHVLAVTVNAGLVHVEVAKGTPRPGPRLAARFWRHYPDLDRLWGGLAVGYTRVSDPILPFNDSDLSDFDLDIDLEESIARRRTGALKALTAEHAAVKPVETPSPEEFGLRFRPGASESSGTRPVEPEPARSPRSEASGLQALANMRDEPKPRAEVPEPARRVSPSSAPSSEDDFSSLNEVPEDDFSSLNDTVQKPRARLSPAAAKSASKVEQAPPEPPPPPETGQEAPPPEPIAAAVAAPNADAPSPSSEAEAASSRDSREPPQAEPAPARAPAETERPSRPFRPLGAVEPRRPAELPTFRPPERASSESSGLRPPPTSEASGLRPPTSEASGLRPPTSESSGLRPPSSESSGLRPPTSESSGFTRLPEPSVFRAPTFKPPLPKEPGPDAPGRGLFRPPPPPEQVEDEPAEVLDDVEAVEDEAPAPAPVPAPTGAPKPPPPKPPPLGLKPRPLQPIFTPPDKKK